MGGAYEHPREVGMVWPLCLPSDQASSQLSVKLKMMHYGNRSPCGSVSLPPKGSWGEVTISGGGEKLASKVIEPGRDVVHFNIPDILASHQAETRLQEDPETYRNSLASLTVFVSKSDSCYQADTTGPASLMLSAPSAVGAELNSIFCNVCEALLELKDSVAHVTVRDVYGFAHLMGNSSSNRISNVTRPRSGHKNPRRQLSSPLRSFPGPSARELDGIFKARKPSSKNSKGGLSQGHYTSSAPAFSSPSPPTRRPSYCKTQLLRDAAVPPWDRDNPQLQAACLTAWHMYFQPLLQELSYVITCVPTACEPGDWDRQTYLETLTRMASFLQHHCMWATLGALLTQTEFSGIQVHVRGQHVSCGIIFATDWLSSSQPSLSQGDITVHYNPPRKKHDRLKDDELESERKSGLVQPVSVDDLLQVFGPVASWLLEGNENPEEDSLFTPCSRGAVDGLDSGLGSNALCSTDLSDMTSGSLSLSGWVNQGAAKKVEPGKNMQQPDALPRIPSISAQGEESLVTLNQRTDAQPRAVAVPCCMDIPWLPPSGGLMRRSYSAVSVLMCQTSYSGCSSGSKLSPSQASPTEDEVTTDSSDGSSCDTGSRSAVRMLCDSSKGSREQSSTCSLSALGRAPKHAPGAHAKIPKGNALAGSGQSFSSRDSDAAETVSWDPSHKTTASSATPGIEEDCGMHQVCGATIQLPYNVCLAVISGIQEIIRWCRDMFDCTREAEFTAFKDRFAAYAPQEQCSGGGARPVHCGRSSKQGIGSRDFVAVLFLCCVTAVVCILAQESRPHY